MSFLESILFLSNKSFLFKAERVKKSEKKENTSRIKIFLKDPATLKNLAYFDSPKNFNPKIKSTLRNLDSAPILYILKAKTLQKRLRIWFFSLEGSFEADEGLDDSSSSFIGELLRQGKIPANRFNFTLANGDPLFSLKPNLTGTDFVFRSLKTEESAVLAEGDRKLMTTWGWDWEFGLGFYLPCDNLTKLLLICSMRAIAPTFYPK